MWHKAIYAVVLTALLAFSLMLLPGEPAQAARGEAPAEVRVVNLPEVQEVEGSVEVEGAVSVEEPVPAASLANLGELVVSPTAGRGTESLLPAGTLDTDGWRHAVLSLAGEVRGRGGAGDLGVVLVPDTRTAARAFEDGRLLFPLETAAEVAADTLWAASEPTEVRLAFPRYRVYLYNTSARSVTARLYAYRTQ